MPGGIFRRVVEAFLCLLSGICRRATGIRKVDAVTFLDLVDKGTFELWNVAIRTVNGFAYVDDRSSA